LQCVLAAKILTVYFVVCTLAVKKNQGRFRHVGSDHSLVRCTWENGSFKTDPTERGYEGANWFERVQDKRQ
jgi:hypothetical protein